MHTAPGDQWVDMLAITETSAALLLWLAAQSLISKLFVQSHVLWMIERMQSDGTVEQGIQRHSFWIAITDDDDDINNE